MSTNIKITIAESSSIIRCGLETLLKRFLDSVSRYPK